MRLDKLLANLKYGTRNEIKKMIKNKIIMVNGNIVNDSSLHVDEENDNITVNGKKVNYRENIYLMLNKPKGYISATFDNYHKTVIDLIAREDRIYNIFPCGRLDIDTEGLLILTNDGKFAHKLMHPKKEVSKTYYAEVEKTLTNNDISLFSSGLEILAGNNKSYKTKKAILQIITGNSCYVTISEGKFHQVKRMFNKVNNKVIYLKRIKIGSLKLDDELKPGEYKELSESEIKLLFDNQYKLEEYK